MFLAGFGIVKYLFSKVIILDVWIVKIFVLTSCDHMDKFVVVALVSVGYSLIPCFIKK